MCGEPPVVLVCKALSAEATWGRSEYWHFSRVGLVFTLPLTLFHGSVFDLPTNYSSFIHSIRHHGMMAALLWTNTDRSGTKLGVRDTKEGLISGLGHSAPRRPLLILEYAAGLHPADPGQYTAGHLQAHLHPSLTPSIQ